MEVNRRLEREQRREERRKQNDFNQKIVDQVLGAVFKQSKLRVDLDMSNDGAAGRLASGLVVVSEESARRIGEVASGATGLGFLEANERLTSMLERTRSRPTTLSDLIEEMRGVLEATRQASTVESAPGRTSMEQLAEPRNSLLIRLKPETFAAIRTAYQALETELRLQGVPPSRIPMAYECVEGVDMALCNQFACFAAYQLAHGRIFSSSQSVYVGQTPAKMNQQMMRIALQKTVNRAKEYIGSSRATAGYGYGTGASPPRYVSNRGWHEMINTQASINDPSILR